MALRRLTLVVAAALTLGACADQGPRSGPGTMTATLVGPNGPEGAAALTLLGDGIGEISPVGATEVHAGTDDGQTFVLLIDQEGGELAFRVAVADTTQPPAWVVRQVAAPDDALRPSVDAYSLEFRR